MRFARAFNRETGYTRKEHGTHSEYIEQRDGGYYVAGTRISLDSVVYAFNRGDSPERILEEFPCSTGCPGFTARLRSTSITGLASTGIS